MNEPDLISVTYLVGITYSTAVTKTIDSPSYIASDKIYLFSGTHDFVVVPGKVLVQACILRHDGYAAS